MNRLVLQRLTICSVVIIGGLSMTTQFASAEQWPQWRGPDFNGVSGETGLPSKWSSTDNVEWRLPLPGPAGSTPVIWDDRIFLTSVDGNDLVLIGASTSGEKLWQRRVTSGNDFYRGDEGNDASPSPSTDGEHVWVYFGDGKLACFTADGDDVWSKDLQQEYGKFEIQFGMHSTPILHDGKLFLQLIHGEWSPEPSRGWVIALDAKSGNELWKQPRNTEAYSECKHSYASPALYEDDRGAFLLTHGADYIIAHDLTDGSELWRCGGLNPSSKYDQTLRFVASPTCTPGMIVVPTAKKGAVISLKPYGEGDITDDLDQQHWQHSNTPDVPCPLIVGGQVYLCQENGILECLDAQTGNLLYEERLTADRYRASPVYADGKVYCTGRKGVISVVQAGPKYELLSQNDMGETITASPAISNGRIIIRTSDALYSIK